MIDGIYSEVKIDHFDDVDNVWCVDAWKTSDDDEEGEVIAKIDGDTYAIEYCNDECYHSREFWNAYLDFMQYIVKNHND